MKKKAIIFNITREIIEIESVKSKILDDNTGYLRITSFNENSSEQIENKIKKIKKNKKVKRLHFRFKE